MIASVAVSLRAKQVDRLFDYVVPTDMQVLIGHRVEVPFGPRRLEGYVILLHADDYETGRELKAITRILDDDGPALSQELVGLLQFLRERYMCTWAAAAQTILPPVTRARVEQSYIFNWVVGISLQAEVVAQLTEAGPLSKKVLKETYDLSEGEFARLVRQGALRPSTQVSQRRKAPTVRMICRTEKPIAPSLRLGPKQRQVIDFLEQHDGKVDWPQLASALSLSQSSVAALVDKGYVKVVLEQVGFEVASHAGVESPLILSDEQGVALYEISASLDRRAKDTYVLHGVTGSGKTEVYLQAIMHALSHSRTALMLVPEIALTAQMTSRIRRRFGDRVAVLHSHLSDREKFLEWHRIQRGLADVVIGARSAIFAPLTNIGLIIVDEEHETTYKQDKDPRYVVREIARFRADWWNATVVLGSATPSLESMYRCDLGRYKRLVLAGRIGNRPLPSVEVVDMRQEFKRGHRSLFSRSLRDAIALSLKDQQQAILFLNRRGYSTFLMCRDCGDVATCPSCDISLTLHRGAHSVLRCHFCGHTESVPDTCKSCGSDKVRQFGAGTQRVEHELLEEFPGIRVVRMDVDTTATKGAHERLLTEFERGEADILLGTQMIAKGLDFERVALVGVIAADTSLHVPDFRAAERTFQLLVQVAGRAGRHGPGRMIIQTFSPDHYAIRSAANQDYAQFYDMELPARKSMEYPPFTELTQYIFSHQSQKVAEEHAKKLHDDLAVLVHGRTDVRLLAAVPAPVARIKGLYRYQVIVRYKSFASIKKILHESYQRCLTGAPVDLTIQVDVNANYVT